jgi:hypothetical protein
VTRVTPAHCDVLASPAVPRKYGIYTKSRLLPGLTIERQRDCQPTTALFVLYWNFVQARHFDDREAIRS